MASTSSPNAEDNFICSICLDVFTNPWLYLTPLEKQECPLCKTEYDKRPMLRVNTFIAQLITDIRNQFKKSLVVNLISQEKEKCFELSAPGQSVTAA